MPELRITRVDDIPWREVKTQAHGDRRVSVWEKYLEWSPTLMVLYARYDAGMLVERHGHRSDHIVYVLDGEIRVGDEVCTSGTNLVLEEGADVRSDRSRPGRRAAARGDDGRPERGPR